MGGKKIEKLISVCVGGGGGGGVYLLGTQEYFRFGKKTRHYTIVPCSV